MTSRSRFLLACLVFAAAVAAPCRAAARPPQGGGSQPAQGQDPSRAAEPSFDLSLPAELAGRKGPDGLDFAEDYRRALIYTAGATIVGQTTVNLAIQAEIERRKAEGPPLPDLELKPEEVELRIQQKMEDVSHQGSPFTFWEQLDLLGFTPESYRSEVVIPSLILDRLFFPPDPDQWPMELLEEEIYASDNDRAIWEQWVKPMRDEFRRARAEGREEHVEETGRQLFLRGPVLRWLLKTVPIREPFHGLPAGVALEVGSTRVPTKELLSKCARVIGPVERERAAAWVETRWAVQAELARRGLLLAPEETLRTIAEEMKEYEGSFLSYEQVALQFLGFPTMEAYRQWYRLRLSFRRSLPDPYPEEMLQDHLEGHASFLRGSQVEPEIILLSARDSRTGLMPRDGDPFGAAAQRAEAVRAKLAAGAEWGAVLMEHSELPDTYASAAGGVPQPRRGRFGAIERNLLRQYLGEDEYLEFATGVAVADHIFFEAEPGVVYGPVRGALGWMFYRVNGRRPPTRDMFLQEVPGQADAGVVERHRYQVGDDLLSVRFRAFVNEVMGRQAG